ncbi:hypothetical protein KM043_002368 [Ampulex compressa]|nr:hypothetical protein KM043_002368 [Ampulex compressa]
MGGPRACGSAAAAASPRRTSRTHNSFDRRPERFRLTESRADRLSFRAGLTYRRRSLPPSPCPPGFAVRRGSSWCTCSGQPFVPRRKVDVQRGFTGGRGAMRISWVFVPAVLLVLATGARCKRKFDGDFEFAEEVSPVVMFRGCLFCSALGRRCLGNSDRRIDLPGL